MRGWTTNTSDPAGGTILSSYNSQGWLTQITEYGGMGGDRVISYTYDNAGRVTSESNPATGATSYLYDAAGNRTRSTDALGHATNYTFDAQNRVTSVTDATGAVTSYAYDLKGNLLSVTAPLGRVTTYQYDAQDRVTRITDPRGAQTDFSYDLAGRLLSITDGAGNVTSYAYDNGGRLVAETDSLAHATTYGYDLADQLTSQTDRNSRQRTFQYDLAGRQTAEKWLDGQGQTIRTIASTFDADGRWTGVSDPSATYTFTYDSDDRLASVDNLGTPGMPRVVLSYQYDNRDKRTQVSDNLGASIQYTYDAGDRMTAVRYGGSQPEVTLGYDAAGRLTNLSRYVSAFQPPFQFSKHINTTIGYDNANRPTSMTHTADWTTLVSYSWTWNDAADLTAETSGDGSLSFSYDAGGQLTGVSGWRTETYSYDATGNRTMSGYQTGTGNRLSTDGTYNYAYDNEGNLLVQTTIATGERVEYVWDYRNRLVEVLYKTSGGTVTKEVDFTYDALDRLIGRRIDPDGSGFQPAVETWTAYDGQHAYADFNQSGSLTNRYLYGPAVDMLLARVPASGLVTWYLTDHLGSVRDLVDPFGAVLDHVKYDSFGRILYESNPTNGDRFKFTAREWEAAVDLYFYRARWYDEDTGRFISEDPLSFAAGDPNVYRYVQNHPTRAVDPSGLDEQIIPIELPPGVPIPAETSLDYEPKIVDYGYGPKYSPKEIFLDMNLNQKTYGGKMVPPAYAPWDTPEYRDALKAKWGGPSAPILKPMTSSGALVFSVSLDADCCLTFLGMSATPLELYIGSTPSEGFNILLGSSYSKGVGMGLGADVGTSLKMYSGKDFKFKDLAGYETQLVVETPWIDAGRSKEGGSLPGHDWSKFPKYKTWFIEVAAGPGAGIYMMEEKSYIWFMLFEPTNE